MKILLIWLSGLVIVLQNSCGTQSETSHKAEESSAISLDAYMRDSIATVDTLDLHFYIPVNAYPCVATTRPLKSDTSVLFVCAGAFTLLDNGKIDGLYIQDGEVKVDWVNHTIGGGIIIPGKNSVAKPSIFGTEMGSRLDSNFVDSICALNASFFQQIQMVRDGQALVFHKDMSLFQRRAICLWHGQLMVVETASTCTLQKFADVLKSCGIQNALYVDMGSWDEGWYRDLHNSINTIGNMRNQTEKQSNWFVYRADN